MKERDAFEEWLYHKKEEDTAGDEFRRYSTDGSLIPVREVRSYSLVESARHIRSLPSPATLDSRCIRLSSNIL